MHLSDKAYISGLYDQKTSLKIEIFFNGQLSNYRFMPFHDLTCGVQGHDQISSGTRIIFPPKPTASGTARESNNDNSAERHWQQICQALQYEVHERSTNEAGDASPTAHFLRALATMRMPDQVHEMQQAAEKTFGTIDIIVTAGEGKNLTGDVGYVQASKRTVEKDSPIVSGSYSGAEPQHLLESSPKIISVDGKDDRKSEEELQSKKEAPMDRTLPLYGTSTTGRQRSATNPPRLSIPALAQPILQNSPIREPIGSRSTLQSSQSLVTNAIDVPSSPGLDKVHKRVPNEQDSYREQKVGVQGPTLIPNNLASGRSPGPYALQLYPSPHSIQLSDPATDVAAPGSLVDQLGSHTAAQNLSLLNCLPPSSSSPARRPCFPYSMHRMGIGQVPFSSSPFTTPYFLPKQPTGDLLNAQFPPPNYNVPHMTPGYLSSNGFQVAIPNVLPRNHIQPHMMYDHTSPLASLSPFHRRLSGPLPPIDFYSVPTKPKRSLSPPKHRQSKRTKKTVSCISISRLVVKGQNGTVLIDRRWIPAKTAPLTWNGLFNHRNQDELTLTNSKIAGSPKCDQRAVQTGRSKKTFVTTDFPLTAPKERNETGSTMTSNLKEKDTEPQSEPLTPKEADTDSIEKRDSFEANNAKLGSLSLTYPTCATGNMSKNYNPSEARTLDVRGPNANPFWLENPDKILREASAAQQRSQPRTKQSKTKTVSPKAALIRPAVPDLVMSGIVDTSPLSSLHTTPELGIEVTADNDSTGKVHAGLYNSLAQMDGDREQSKTSYATQSPSIVRPDVAAQLRIGQYPQTTTQSASNKEHTSTTKKPHSPGCLKTNDNLMITQGCVIAFAECKDDDRTHEVLRQAEGEKAGIFIETYVVSAMRFFVGDSST